MRQLREKLKSQSGASILMALLFLLVCMMVSASLLAAAVSNAGKYRSNRIEQQNYLMISSAMQLVCDAVTDADYHGLYNYRRTPVFRIELDEEGNEIPVLDHYIHEFQQVPGRFQCRMNLYTGGAGTADILPVGADLDAVFAQGSNFRVAHEYPNDEYVYNPLGVSFSGVHRISLSVDLDGDGWASNGEIVQIAVSMQQNGIVRLSGTIHAETSGKAYVMEAELVPKENPQKTLRLGHPAVNAAAEEEVFLQDEETPPVKWTLNWIAKKEAEAA